MAFMTHFVLYHAPGACSRVTMNALEECGLVYEDRPLNLFVGANKAADYLAVNPRGKVPALLVDGHLLTENAAILLYLHARCPAAGLLPATSDPVVAAQQTADLIACASTWHPTIRAVRMPIRLTKGDPAPVREMGIEILAPMIADLDARVSGGRWWFGKDWSIVDVYLFWNVSIAASGGLDARPSFQRALAREVAAAEAASIQFPPGFSL
jgi:glutathione S-transferase